MCYYVSWSVVSVLYFFVSNIHEYPRGCPKGSKISIQLVAIWTTDSSEIALNCSGAINKSLTDLVCQLEYGDDVANTVTKAHRDLERSTVISA
jgi:hypothetical protein